MKVISRLNRATANNFMKNISSYFGILVTEVTYFTCETSLETDTHTLIKSVILLTVIA